MPTPNASPKPAPKPTGTALPTTPRPVAPITLYRSGLAPPRPANPVARARPASAGRRACRA